MPDQKLDNLLNLALGATPEERGKSQNLQVGYDETQQLWDVIVKYSGPESGLMGDGVTVEPLLGGYAVVTLPEQMLNAYAARPQVEFIEMPKRLYFALYEAKQVSCIRSVQTGGNISGNRRQGLSGRGILVGIVDSGVNYRHPDFRNEDGTTRILKIWDQSAQAEYTKEMIDQALLLPANEGYDLVPERDFSGHGTAVLGIAAGNGRTSNGRYQGVAYESDLIVVKLGQSRENSFPRTAELMRGIDYLARQAMELGRPMAINLSFGNNYGSHEPCN